MTHVKVGDIALPVGSYEKQGQKRNRNRTIGTLMRTDYHDGSRLWIKLNGDALSPSLLMLAMKSGALEAGDDGVIANVFEPREQQQQGKPAAAPAAAEMDDDRIPF